MRFDSEAALQPANASRAARTARSTSASEANATRAVTWPVAGSCTSPKRSAVVSGAPPIQWPMVLRSVPVSVMIHPGYAAVGDPEGAYRHAACSVAAHVGAPVVMVRGCTEPAPSSSCCSSPPPSGPPRPLRPIPTARISSRRSHQAISTARGSGRRRTRSSRSGVRQLGLRRAGGLRHPEPAPDELVRVGNLRRSDLQPVAQRSGGRADLRWQRLDEPGRHAAQPLRDGFLVRVRHPRCLPARPRDHGEPRSRRRRAHELRASARHAERPGGRLRRRPEPVGDATTTAST